MGCKGSGAEPESGLPDGSVATAGRLWNRVPRGRLASVREHAGLVYLMFLGRGRAGDTPRFVAVAVPRPDRVRTLG